jgi:hypothetical protein
MVKALGFFIAFIFMGLGVTACSSSTPDPYDAYAGAEFTIECKHTTGPCYFKSQERCRRGYNVVSTVETEKTGGVYGRYRAYIMVIRCNK